VACGCLTAWIAGSSPAGGRGYSFHVFIVCCVGSSLCDELITRSGECYRVFVCVLETLTMRRPKAELGCCAGCPNRFSYWRFQNGCPCRIEVRLAHLCSQAYEFCPLLRFLIRHRDFVFNNNNNNNNTLRSMLLSSVGRKRSISKTISFVRQQDFYIT
jgi:hypothetical protein